jgi:uncharacterized membrane protein (DUF4010 family)
MTPSAEGVALLLGLSFFLGLAYEDVFAHAGTSRPGGIRTFPMLAILGGMLYAFDPTHLVAFAAGLLVLGAWLVTFYREQIHERDEDGQPNVGLMAVLLNLYAYSLGAIALAFDHWVAVATTVAAVLLFTSRRQLHELARRVDMKEIATAAQFLVLTGIVLPLLPDRPVTTLTSVTPRAAWLALLVVCSFSYGSYLLQRYVVPGASGLWMAALGGLYSSTTTTVVLARQAASEPAAASQVQAGITLATAMMYPRVLATVAVFNFPLALALAPAMVGLTVLAVAIALAQYRRPKGLAEPTQPMTTTRNPLEIGAAAVFALMFIVTSLAASVVTRRFGVTGTYALAAVIGVTDINPFVLNLAQGDASGLPASALAAAILVACSSNNALKAGYAVAFAGWRASGVSAVVLAALAILGIGAAFAVARL